MSDQLAATVDAVEFRFAGYFHSAANVMVHAHPCVEIVLVHRGHCTMEVAGVERHMQGGELIIIPRQEPHDQKTDADLITYYVGGSWPEALLSTAARVVDVSGDPFIHRWMGDLVDHYKYEPEGQQAVTRALLAAVIGRIRWREEAAATATRLHPHVAAAITYIEGHLRDDMTVARIAEAAGCSASHLTAMFRQSLHTSPMAYLTQTRLKLACKHLLEPYLNVKQIAAACGWDDPNLFVRIFRQQLGCPPGKWRTLQSPQLKSRSP